MARLSIRMKILLVFMVLFTVVFIGAFLWFYHFSMDQATESLRQDLMHSASIGAAMVDASEHSQLLASGQEGDAAYMHIASQLHLLRQANPRITNIYTLVPSSDPGALLFGVDLDIAYPEEVEYDEDELEETDDSDAAAAGEAGSFMGTAYDITAFPEIIKGFEGPAADTRIMKDEDYGDTLSGYAPILDLSGRAVAILGVDMDAEDIVQIQNRILIVSLIVFVIAYLAIFAGAFTLSGVLTRSLRLITDASIALENGQPFDPQQLAPATRSQDELGNLARIFSKMALQVQAREKELRQTVSTLRIEIDQMKRQTSVAEITENADFMELKEKVRLLRQQRTGKDQ